MLVGNSRLPKQGQWPTSDRRLVCSTHGQCSGWNMYIYMRSVSFTHCIIIRNFENILLFTIYLNLALLLDLNRMLSKFMRREGPQLSLLFNFKISLFSGEYIGEKPSYNHLAFFIDTASSSDYTSLRISLIYTLVPKYVYHLIQQFTIYNISNTL
jgi:hypothetical protein